MTGTVVLTALVVALLSAGVPSRAEDTSERPVAFDDLPGITTDDLPAALESLRASCAAIMGGTPSVRAAVATPASLGRACAEMPPAPTSPAVAKAFFAAHFAPRRVAGGAFFTGYYEPVVDGSLAPTAAFATPLLAAPVGLVTIRADSDASLDPALTSARRLPDGRVEALPDRAAIESGKLGDEAKPLAFVASPVEAFFIQVQGSVRIRLPDGKLKRLVYAGRNGYPYTSIGKLLVQRLHIPPDKMGMKQLREWIEGHGQHPGDAGAALMQENRSYIFFRFDDALPAEAGPIGGEGISLKPLRSLAVDRSLWPYGLPFFVDTTWPDGTPLRRLMTAQDTGAAIRGPARADIFLGSGPEAGARAGALRQSGTLYVLWPKEPGAEAAPR